MTEKMLKSIRAGRQSANDARMRRLYPRVDSAPQLPPQRGSRRPQFCAPLRSVYIKVRGAYLVDATAWGFANNMPEEPITNDK